jgi:RNA polymerase sigma-70 factor (ECF subfamily)
VIARSKYDCYVTTSFTPVDAIPNDEIEMHRQEITGYCYRMLGSVYEADDAAQDTMVRAWQALPEFEGRSSIRTWLFRIATNVCIDMLRGQKRRAQPMDLGSSSPAELRFLAPMDMDQPWLLPMPSSRCGITHGDPEVAVVERESVRLAFVAALQHLPARQRAVLILCEVLRFSASEVADLLETTVASVNSALQRARATLATCHLAQPLPTLESDQRILLEQFVEAFESYDIARLATLLRDDAIQSMPPFAMWIQGSNAIAQWMLGPGAECDGSRLIPTSANGCTAFGQYRRAETFGDAGGGHLPWALQVVEVSDGKVSEIHAFLDADLFTAFGLPSRLDP